MSAVARAGEEFREDLRAPGARNAQARRLLSPAELEPLTRAAAPYAEVSLWPRLDEALQTALGQARANDLVLITGSLFLVGETLVWWRCSPR